MPKTMFLVDSSKENESIWAPGIKPVTEKGFGNEASRFDVREFLTAFGAHLPSNAIATFEEGHGVLMVIGPRADIDAIESFYLAGYCGAKAKTLQAEFTLVSFTNPRNKETHGIGARELRKLAGNSWREEEHMTLLTKSGQRSIASMRTDLAGRSDAGLAPNELGMQAELEAVLAPDGFTIDVNLAVSRRGPFGGDKIPLNFEVNNLFVVADSSAIVVQIWPIVRDDAKSAPLQAALILRMRMLNEHGQPLREAFQRVKK